MKKELMSRKGEGPLQTFLIVIVVVAFFSVSSLTFLGSLGSQYGKDLSETTTFDNVNYYSEINESAENMRESLNDLTSYNPIDVASGFFSGGWEAIKLFTVKLPKFMNNILLELEDILGISYLAEFVYLVTLIILIFGILAIIMKVRA